MALVFADFTADEETLVSRIIDRSRSLGDQHDIAVDPESLYLDLAATHGQIPLRLADLANADDFNFVHDIFGIMNHMDRNTGQLTDYFVPRYAKPVVD